MCWYAAFGIGAVTVPSDKFWDPCAANARVQVVGQVQWVTLDCKPYRIPWNRVSALFSPKIISDLPPRRSARRIIRNLFITLASLVSPTDVKVV